MEGVYEVPFRYLIVLVLYGGVDRRRRGLQSVQAQALLGREVDELIVDHGHSTGRKEC